MGAYGQAQSAAPGGYAPPQAPVHPDANSALITGIIAVAGAFVCILPLFASPFAWYMGSKAIKTVRASNGQYRGETEARIGQVLGIIGTVFLALGVLAIATMIFFIVIAGTASYESTGFSA